jgi:mannose PTS system EIIA component
MTTILIIAHAPLASALRAVAEHAYPGCGGTIEVLDVAASASIEQVEADARALLARHAHEDALVFVDAFGATPSSGAKRLLDNPRTRVVAGVNVPMLWRTLCYGTDGPLDALAARAMAGATQGVMPVTAPKPQNQTLRTGHDDQAHGHDQQ